MASVASLAALTHRKSRTRSAVLSPHQAVPDRIAELYDRIVTDRIKSFPAPWYVALGATGGTKELRP